MLRTISSLIFTVIGIMIGCSKSNVLKSKITVCREIESVVERIIYCINMRNMDVYEICADLKENCKYDILSFIKELPTQYDGDYDFHTLWNKELNRNPYIDTELKGILFETGMLLGTIDVNGQTEKLKSILKELESIKEISINEYREKGKLYKSVGLLSGLLLGILII